MKRKLLYLLSVVIIFVVVLKFVNVGLQKQLIILIAALLVNSFVYVKIVSSANKSKNGTFFDEINLITDEYMKDRDHEKYLNALQNMNHKPKTQDAKNAYYFDLCNVYYNMGKYQEASDNLDLVRPRTDGFQDKVERQRKLIDEAMK